MRLDLRELVIVANHRAAEHAGFKPSLHHHPQDDHIDVWWPGRGLRMLHGMRYSRITISDTLRRHLYEGRYSAAERHEWDEAEHRLREHINALDGAGIWMEF
jgi:hypothetical protein